MTQNRNFATNLIVLALLPKVIFGSLKFGLPGVAKFR